MGESRDVTREPHAKGDASARGGEKRESSPSPPPLAASLLARSRSLAASFVRYNWRSCSQAAFFFDFENGKICIKLTG